MSSTTRTLLLMAGMQCVGCAAYACGMLCRHTPHKQQQYRPYRLQAQIIDILLEAVKVEAAISLPPILHVLSCLARDLQQDFLPYLPRVLTTAVNLVNSGADCSTT